MVDVGHGSVAIGSEWSFLVHHLDGPSKLEAPAFLEKPVVVDATVTRKLFLFASWELPFSTSLSARSGRCPRVGAASADATSVNLGVRLCHLRLGRRKWPHLCCNGSAVESRVSLQVPRHACVDFRPHRVCPWRLLPPPVGGSSNMAAMWRT